MLTRWGKELDPDAVLQEYPRPQLRRDSYLNLNGFWDYAMTASDQRPDGYDGQILVPFSPESELSGVNRTLTPEGRLWYRRAIELPDGFLKDRLLLHFGAVDQIATVWVNGTEVGGHVGGFTPFSIDITAAWNRGGANEVIVRVVDTTDTSWHSRGKQRTKRGGIWYTPQSGIWQTVWMESVPNEFIRGLTIRPDFDGSAVEITIDGGVGELRCSAEVDGRTVEGRTGRPIRLDMTGFEPWTPETPKLYDLTVRMGEDRVESYFGMRKVAIEKGADGVPRFMLNNRAIFQSGLLDQGYWSDGMLTAPSDDALIADIAMAKAMGFNMLRKHIKVEPLRWYYHCDRLGMLVWQDMVNGGGTYSTALISVPVFLRLPIRDRFYRLFARGDRAGRAQYRVELDEMIAHLRNVPSIVVWVPFNEGWGQFDAVETTTHLRAADPTRLVDSASGWYDQGCGDFSSRHVYFKPVRFEADGRGRAAALSEFGGYNLRIPGHAYNEKDFGYKRLSSREELGAWLRRLYREEISPAVERGLVAAIYTQLSDVEDELNGLVTYDREVVKVDAAAMRELNLGMRRVKYGLISQMHSSKPDV